MAPYLIFFVFVFCFSFEWTFTFLWRDYRSPVAPHQETLKFIACLFLYFFIHFPFLTFYKYYIIFFLKCQMDFLASPIFWGHTPRGKSANLWMHSRRASLSPVHSVRPLISLVKTVVLYSAYLGAYDRSDIYIKGRSPLLTSRSIYYLQEIPSR